MNSRCFKVVLLQISHIKSILISQSICKEKILIISIKSFCQEYMTNILQSEYKKYHNKILENLFNKGYHGQIVHQNMPPSFLLPSLICCNLYEECLEEIKNQNLRDSLSFYWMTISTYMVGNDCSDMETQLEQDHQKKYYNFIKDWKGKKNPLHHSQEEKALLRNQYEDLLKNAQEQNYFSLKKMPIYLIPKKWLDLFYSDEIQFIPGIDSRQLTEPMNYLQKNPQGLYLNYKIKKHLTEGTDYQIVSFETWQFLKKKFGGIQTKRFITSQKSPINEIYLKELKVIVANNRFIHTDWELTLLVSRLDTIEQITKRVQSLMFEYQLLTVTELNRKWEPVKVTNIPTQELIDLLFDEELELSANFTKFKDSKIERMQSKNTYEQCEISQESDVLLFIMLPCSNFINLSQIPFQVVTVKYNVCLTCGSNEKLFFCQCKTVYFCSIECKVKNIMHENDCSRMTKQQDKRETLFKSYGSNKYIMQWTALPKQRPVGMENFGNTCYFNAALQFLLSIDSFNIYFCGNRHLDDLNIDNILGTEGHLACAYGELVKEYYTTNRKSIQPYKIFSIVGKNNPQFKGYHQQDSQELLSYFLDKLHEDLNRVQEKPYVEDVRGDGRPDQVISNINWENYLKRNQSFISEKLAGQYRSEIKCPQCEQVSVTFDPFMSITLPFPTEVRTEEINGFYLTPEGEFEKVETKAMSAMKTQEFVSKYFHERIDGQWLQKKKPRKRWNLEQSIYTTYSEKGILLFYPHQQNYNIEINYQIEGYDIFHRRVFAQNVYDENELLKFIYLNIKKPLLKTVRKEKGLKKLDMTNEDYLEECFKKLFLEIKETNPNELIYPLTAGEYHIKIYINPEVMADWAITAPIKFDVSSRAYTEKQKVIIRTIRSQITFQELFEQFYLPERLTEDNSWYCPNCRKHQKAEKLMCLFRVPEYMIVHLKRFNHRGNRYMVYGEKVTTKVKLQTTQIICGQKYELIATVSHAGSINSGHYTASCVRNSRWWNFSDTWLTEGKAKDDVYLLLFRRVES